MTLNIVNVWNQYDNHFVIMFSVCDNRISISLYSLALSIYAYCSSSSIYEGAAATFQSACSAQLSAVNCLYLHARIIYWYMIISCSIIVFGLKTKTSTVTINPIGTMLLIILSLLLVASADYSFGGEIVADNVEVYGSNAYNYFDFVRQWSPNGCYKAQHHCKKLDPASTL